MAQRSKQQRLNCLRKKVLKFGYFCTGMTLTDAELMRFKCNSKYVSETFTGLVQSLIIARKKRKKEIIQTGIMDYLTIIPPAGKTTPISKEFYEKFKAFMVDKDIKIITPKTHKPRNTLYDHI